MKNKISFYAFMVISASLLVFNFSFFPQNILSWDVFGYYMYLPMTFIHDNLGLQDTKILPAIIDQYHNSDTLYQAYQTTTGSWVMRYPMGMAFLYAPFFFLAHFFAGLTDYARDGFSLPYQAGVLCAGIFYSLTGFYFLRKVLLCYFTDLVAAITLCIVFFGTNYFLHSSFVGTNAMSHNYLFTLYAIIIWLTIKWHESFRLKTLVLLALVCGLTIIARPSELVCLFIPLFWGLGSSYNLKEKLVLFLKTYREHTLVFMMILCVVGMPQLLYWKVVTGKFLFNSYDDNPGEGFEFAHPFLKQVLFSFRKGWLVYTPLMIFAVAGLFYSLKKKIAFAVPIVIYFFINLYIVSSWSCWWYAESFGQRSLIQSYALLALPLASMVYLLVEKQRKVLKYGFLTITTLFVFLNFFQTWQYLNGVIHPSRMTKEAYLAVFGKRDTPENFEKMLVMDRSGGPVSIDESEYVKTKEWIEEFDQGGNTTTEQVYSGSHSLRMDSVFIYSPAIQKAFQEITSEDHAKLKVKARVYTAENIKDNPGSLVITFEHKQKSYGYSATDIEKLAIEQNKWTEISVNYLTPIIRNPSDTLKIYYWHRGRKVLYLDKLTVEVWERKQKSSN